MTGQIMTNLKTVEEVADDYFGIKTSFVLERKGFEQTLTQDRQSHCDELVRLLKGLKTIPEHSSECLHNEAPEYCDCDNYIKWNKAKDQALTIVKEIYKVKN